MGSTAMNETHVQKPSYEEWLYWSQVVIARLTTVVHVYNKPPFTDVFMPENERQMKVSLTVDIIRRLHSLTDDVDFQSTEEAQVAGREQVIDNVQPIFRDVLHRLPTFSSDMQSLLKSPWYDKCAGKIANDLFRGPDGRESEGIGSGHPEHGRLPEVLETLLEREIVGGARAPSEEKRPQNAPTIRREELARLWGKRNSSFLRSAGRVD